MGPARTAAAPGPVCGSKATRDFLASVYRRWRLRAAPGAAPGGALGAALGAALGGALRVALGGLTVA
jgi:hypothetical protein